MEVKVQKMSKTTIVLSLGKLLEETLFPIAMFLESVKARNIVSRKCASKEHCFSEQENYRESDDKTMNRARSA